MTCTDLGIHLEFSPYNIDNIWKFNDYYHLLANMCEVMKYQIKRKQQEISNRIRSVLGTIMIGKLRL